ncbi:hypothetical protein BDZ45DRAFT_689829 [Acephala macrosclerotiorum]|nr:hypothetical protein BDZ45DRAFT_689829 [Acephala macrosclerotiorum]
MSVCDRSNQAVPSLSQQRPPQHSCEMGELGKVTSLLEVQEGSDYKYAPLKHPDSIRLLLLAPGEMESPIQIFLAEFRLQENPPYEALSYTWATEDGDCSLSSQIRCGDARLWITKNCELLFDIFGRLIPGESFHDKAPKANGVWNSFGLASNHLDAVRRALRVDGASEQSLAFLEVAHKARDLIASNPRDNIFGVLGLSDKFKTLVPPPDYSKTTTEVFTDVAKSLLGQTKSLSVLEHATSTAP